MQDLEELKGMLENGTTPTIIINNLVQLAIAEQTSRLADAQEGILKEMKNKPFHDFIRHRQVPVQPFPDEDDKPIEIT